MKNRKNICILIFLSILILLNIYYIAGSIFISNIKITEVIRSFLYIVILVEYLFMIIILNYRKKLIYSIMYFPKIMGITIIMASIIFPRIEGYIVKYEIGAWNDIVLADGFMLVVGILIFSFGSILKDSI